MPLPRLTLRVGITGHRLDKLQEAEAKALPDRLGELFAALDAALLRLHGRLAGRLYARDAAQCRLVSALAEGADRLAVEAAPPAWAVAALLPMPRAEYRRDFLAEGQERSPSTAAFEAHLAQAETVTELAMVASRRSAAPPQRAMQYAALGQALVRQVDCLVAVWDGQAPKGPGGTATVIAEAMDHGLAVLWIDPTSGSPPGEILRFRGGDIGRPDLGPADAAALDALLDRLLGFEAPDGQPPPLAAALPQPSRWSFAYPLLLRCAKAGRPGARKQTGRRWPPPDPLLSQLEAERPGAAAAVADARRILGPRSWWADMLGWSYARLYRSAYVTAFLLAGLAVPIGLLALFADKTAYATDVKALAVAIELCVVLFVTWLVLRGRRRHWHTSWIEARELSELLRVARPLHLVGRTLDLFDPTPLATRAREPFAIWYARATLRELKPVPGLHDSGYLRLVLSATRDHLLSGQIAYHRGDARALARVDHFLHVWGDRCFIATIAVLALYLALWALAAMAPSGALVGVLAAAKPVTSIMAASLPALGAAFAGIRAQGEFANRVRQSESTAAELATIVAEIDEALAAPADEILPEHASDLLVEAARVMLDDVRHWRHVYVGKTLALPS